MPILPVPFPSRATAAWNWARSTPVRIAVRSEPARAATASTTSPEPSCCGGSDSLATASARSASCSSANPLNPTRTENRTTAALLTPLAAASDSAVSNGASAGWSSRRWAIRRSFGES